VSGQELFLLLILRFVSASGDTYTAYQAGTNLSVAIKQLSLDKQSRKDRIVNEILVMRTTRHPNVVHYMDSFLHNNDVWIITEYAEGGNLTDLVTAALMTEGQIAAVSRETAQGLEYLHSRGVIHRNIKSSNILLSLRGDIKLSTCCCWTKMAQADAILF
jgi:p21-activated kinase 1